MKIFDINGETAEAGAFVVMMENRSWLRPIQSCATMDLAFDTIRKKLEEDACAGQTGGIPGQVKFYVVPVEAK